MTYESGQRSKSGYAVVEDMTRVIQAQVSHHVYISLHLRGEAVDIRERDMSTKQLQIFEAIVRAAGLPAPIHEGKPEHLHLQFR